MATGAQRAADGEHRNRDILIVEDETDLAETCVRFLRRIGYCPRAVHTGSEALAAITMDAPDLVIADLRLPGAIDGLDVVRHARLHAWRIPVIVWTAQGSDRVRQECLEAGAVEYLPKPFSLAELRAAVERALGPDEALRDSTRSSPVP